MKGLASLLAAAVIGAVAWGSCQAGRASEAERRLAAALTADSLEAEGWARQRDSLSGVLRGLQADSALLAVRYATARRAAVVAQDSIGRLLTALPDSQRLPLERAVRTVQLATEACQESLDNCERRAFNAEARAHGDSTRLAATRALLDTTEAAWKAAEQRARPSMLRDFWRSRALTVPLAALILILLLKQ